MMTENKTKIAIKQSCPLIAAVKKANFITIKQTKDLLPFFFLFLAAQHGSRDYSVSLWVHHTG